MPPRFRPSAPKPLLTESTPRKARPSTAISLTTSSNAPTPMASPLSRPLLESMLSPPPDLPPLEVESAPEPVLLTCPHCSYICTYHLTPTSFTHACTRCLRRFKKHERREWNDQNRLTQFPCLLEEHAVLMEREERKREEEGSGYGSLGRIMSAVWGGSGMTTERRDSLISRDSRRGSGDEASGGGTFGLSSMWSR
ncbi:hypothetical protein CC86DRAFT_102078 [Ophiobolus disseminans]|uniref:Uncharacterized protein n=1 Tax=Ophiobolus disseminans TaxID=1469910 RepID=A0A6A6ZLB8_9PLEO|nr:hypothetical protein CC86DRAFT_102078 [Ophiobolus disseminans]